MYIEPQFRPVSQITTIYPLHSILILLSVYPAATLIKTGVRGFAVRNPKIAVGRNRLALLACGLMEGPSQYLNEFGVRSGSVRDPFRVRSGSVRTDFGPKFSEPTKIKN